MVLAMVSRPKRVFIVAIAIAQVGTYATLGVMAAGKFSFDAMLTIVSGILSCRGREIAVYLLPTCLGLKILIGIPSGERFCLLLCRSPGCRSSVVSRTVVTTFRM